ncbi:MAG TPA: hypothetical protein P5234_15335 [Thermoanaerobaculaceae bacterium]|nr:hypothetical protein [Thermoanaerobaculaceae bacterium]HRS17608.1 hypothetical protein [Thermoanaerobaculaceae bacterium]
MRREYSILALLALAASAAAGPCPPALEAVAARVAELRGVQAPFLPPCRFVPISRLGAELDAKLRRDLPLPPELYVEALQRLGFIDAGPVYPRLLEFYSSQVLGFYEPGADEMVLVQRSDGAPAGDPTVWAHELAHAVQERRFGLPARLLAMRHNSDRQRAMSAIAEGDATLVMLVLSQASPPSLEALRATQRHLASQADTFPAPPGVPDFFVKDLAFPYAQGLATVLTAYERGGWKAVDDLLRRPPDSTSELLHPARRPLGPPLLDAELPPPPAGFTTVLTDTLGEWALAYWLGRRLPAAEASRLAATWDGDRLRLARNSQGEWALTLLVRCREASGSRELATALRVWGPALLSGLTPGREPEFEVAAAGRLVTMRSPRRPVSLPAPTP